MSTASITLLTGLPGNGKTLHAVSMVKELADKENRPVFYSGIDINKEVLPWQEIDPLKWFEAPVNSIVIIDECWKAFPVRTNGAAVPAHVERVATVRHGGINLFLITQHPSQVDLFVRRLIGRHIHHVRRFGLQACALFEWPRVVDNCDKTRKDAIASEWRYNKDAYGWYKSSEIHTFKAKIPLKVLWIVAPVLLIPIAIWAVMHLLQGQRNGFGAVPASAASAASSPGSFGAVPSGPGGRSMALNAHDYVQQFRPRVPGLDYTAPVYDEVTKPVRAPYPAACVTSKTKGCLCYSQQGTKLELDKGLCEGIVAGGFFIAWDEKRGEQRMEVNKPPALASAESREPLPGLINVTPGYTPVHGRPVAEQVADGENLRHGKNNRIPG